jgi:hypothetical protein
VALQVRLTFLMNTLARKHRQVMLVGTAGTGKTAIALEYLRSLNKDVDKLMYTSINMSYFTDSVSAPHHTPHRSPYDPCTFFPLPLPSHPHTTEPKPCSIVCPPDCSLTTLDVFLLVIYTGQDPVRDRAGDRQALGA